MDRNDDNNNKLNAKLQLKCEDLIQNLDGIQRKDLEWSTNKYRVDNDIINTKLEWNVKRYWVDNDTTSDTKLEWILKKYRVDNNIINTKLDWILKRYRVDNNNIKKKPMLRNNNSIGANLNLNGSNYTDDGIDFADYIINLVCQMIRTVLLVRRYDESDYYGNNSIDDIITRIENSSHNW